jgi:hypothetical protein
MKRLKNNAAELILVTLTVAALSSCSSFNNKAEAQEQNQYMNTIDCVDCFTIDDYYSSLECENCDEID